MCNYCPHKDNPYVIRLTIGYNRLTHLSDSGSPAENLLETEIIFNSIISITGSQFIFADIKDYFLCSLVDSLEYIKIPLCWIPKRIHIQFNLYSLVEPDVYVYYKLMKGMEVLKKAARLIFYHLVNLLAPHGSFLVQ